MKQLLYAGFIAGFLVAGSADLSNAASLGAEGQFTTAHTEKKNPPEPTTMLIFGLALAAITAVSRKNE